MVSERFTWEYDFKSEFPNARELKRLPGETVYTAERDGKFYVIDDRSLQADFLCPSQPGVDEPNWIEVIAFDTATERQQYCDERWQPQMIRMDWDI